MPRITTAHAAPNDTATDAQDMIFIVPRREDRLLIGGLVQPGQWGTTLDPGDGPVRDMLNRAVEFLPSLRHSRLDETDLLRATPLSVLAGCDWLPRTRHPNRAQLRTRRR